MPLLSIPTGATLYYDDVGGVGENAPRPIPVIALHGWLGTGQAHLANVINWLSGEGFRVIAPTRRGYGESLPKPRDYPHDFYHRDAKDILALMDALNIEKAHLLGYSDGGETVLVMAGLQPTRAASVAAWGAVGYYPPEMRPLAQANYPATWMTEDVRALNHIPDDDAANALVLGWSQAVTQMIDAGGDVSVSLAPNISAQLVIMLGESDRLNPPSSAEVFLRGVKNGRLEMFACGHPVHDEQWDGFRRVVGELVGIGG